MRLYAVTTRIVRTKREQKVVEAARVRFHLSSQHKNISSQFFPSTHGILISSLSHFASHGGLAVLLQPTNSLLQLIVSLCFRFLFSYISADCRILSYLLAQS